MKKSVIAILLTIQALMYGAQKQNDLAAENASPLNKNAHTDK